MKDTQDLLFEIGTEELPPKALKNLAESLAVSLEGQLQKSNFAFENIKYYASPRRLAVIIDQVQVAQEDKKITRQGPFVSAAFDKMGKPTPAALGFARSCGVEDVAQLDKVMTDKGEKLAFDVLEKGKKLDDVIEVMLKQAIKLLPIPKMMRWGNYDYQFVRPVHWIVLMLGEHIIPIHLFGHKATDITYGHRFHAPAAITVSEPKAYVKLLKEKGHVLVDWNERKSMLTLQANEIATKHHAKVVLDEELVEEVTAIVEYPHALTIEFEEYFLRVPQEALISAMQGHQKCFPMVGFDDKLKNYCITISNIDSQYPQAVVDGNKKVITARLADAAFFYDTDLKTPLDSHLIRLERVTFQKSLGTMADKSKRIAQLAQWIAEVLNENKDHAFRSGILSKTDLMTEMVYEFPELQGVMGRYYAKAHGESDAVANALYDQYLPRFSGDELPKTVISQSVALADRVDTLVGIFGIGLKPTGEKDPFALRRQALAVLRILKEYDLKLDLSELLKKAQSFYEVHLSEKTVSDVFDFMMERLKGIYRDEGVNPQVFESVRALNITHVGDFNRRIDAVCKFIDLPQAQILASLNKRVAQILQKNFNGEMSDYVNTDLLCETAEQGLYDQMHQIDEIISVCLKDCHYQKSLAALTELESAISQFFDHVMVMTEDDKIRVNRLALLKQLQQNLNRVADISQLAI
ncbi:glycine--tRNA ligase subunit beta [Thiotrichales bacterium 19S3-7]|nr:glycine--tRNA ligase subunit beta [Thiotrichales bacterium 19S3-7]MCF6802768.1 glycine--tRNA ligase subunit beta [Thiotrichales bacterium 19S3-11]